MILMHSGPPLIFGYFLFTRCGHRPSGPERSRFVTPISGLKAGKRLLFAEFLIFIDEHDCGVGFREVDVAENG